MIYVTHDQVEAMTMADKIVVLRAGVTSSRWARRWSSTGEPRSLFVAGFIGSPKMNILPEGDGHVGIRPEHIDISTTSGKWQGTVGISEHLGSDTSCASTCRGWRSP